MRGTLAFPELPARPHPYRITSAKYRMKEASKQILLDSAIGKSRIHLGALINILNPLRDGIGVNGRHASEELQKRCSHCKGIGRRTNISRRPWSCSGAAYPKLPTKTLVRSSSLSPIVAIPKSIKTTRPSLEASS